MSDYWTESFVDAVLFREREQPFALRFGGVGAVGGRCRRRRGFPHTARLLIGDGYIPARNRLVSQLVR